MAPMSYNNYKRSNESQWSRAPKIKQPSPPASPVRRKEYVPMKGSEVEVANFRTENEISLKGTHLVDPIMRFEDLGIGEGLIDSLRRNFLSPTPIQAQGIPIAMTGRDMVGIAQTGSGKTLSFVVPALIHANHQSGKGPFALILAPTRELCLQISEVVMQYERVFNLRSIAVYGGVSTYPQKKALREGVDVLIATPGRLIDLYEQGCLSLSRISFLVLDEADRMLDMGFEPQLKQIIPKVHREKQTLMWSATWPREVRALAIDYMNEFIQVNVGEDELTINTKIEQKIEVLEGMDKKRRLNEILKDAGLKKVIVFSNTKKMCDDLEYQLNHSVRCASFHGDKSQAVRDRIIDDFKKGRKNILFATDVAARGLDVKDVFMVVNYDFPKQCEDYVHRIGRTGRGSAKEGKSITFFTYTDIKHARRLCQLLDESKCDVPSELRNMGARGNHAAPRRNNYHGAGGRNDFHQRGRNNNRGSNRRHG